MARSIRWQIDDQLDEIENKVGEIVEDINSYIVANGDNEDGDLEFILTKIKDLAKELI